ncbi:MAG: hypothetical protein ACRCS4_06920 [Flavobacterium sp.]
MMTQTEVELVNRMDSEAKSLLGVQQGGITRAFCSVYPTLKREDKAELYYKGSGNWKAGFENLLTKEAKDVESSAGNKYKKEFNTEPHTVSSKWEYREWSRMNTDQASHLIKSQMGGLDDGEDLRFKLYLERAKVSKFSQPTLPITDPAVYNMIKMHMLSTTNMPDNQTAAKDLVGVLLIHADEFANWISLETITQAEQKAVTGINGHVITSLYGVGVVKTGDYDRGKYYGNDPATGLALSTSALVPRGEAWLVPNGLITYFSREGEKAETTIDLRDSNSMTFIAFRELGHGTLEENYIKKFEFKACQPLVQART